MQQNNISLGCYFLLILKKLSTHSLEWSFVNRTLEYFGFGPSLTTWIRTFYNNIEIKAAS